MLKLFARDWSNRIRQRIFGPRQNSHLHSQLDPDRCDCGALSAELVPLLLESIEFSPPATCAILKLLPFLLLLGSELKLDTFETPVTVTPQQKISKTLINSVQTRCIVKGEAQKSPLL